MWNHPESIAEICELFVKYCRNELDTLPWSDSPLHSESDVIRERLTQVNRNGFLTINSQPAVDGVSSLHPVHGWGPKNGFVYQKAYVRI